MECVQQRCVEKVCRFLEKGLDPNFHDTDTGGIDNIFLLLFIINIEKMAIQFFSLFSVGRLT